MEEKSLFTIIKEYFLIFVGTLIMGIGITVFFEPNELVVGGFSGLGIIIQYYVQEWFGISIELWLSNVLLNLPLFVVAAKVFGVKGLGRTLFATAALSISLYVTSFVPKTVVQDYLLASLFGGAIEGLGLGLVFRYSATTGGTDLVAALIRRIYKRMPVTKIMFIVDAIIIMIGFFAFGAEKAMYAIIAAFVVSKTMDAALEGLSFAKAAFIISDNADEIADELLVELNRGVTGLDGKGMFTKYNKTVLLCVVNTKELVELKEIVLSVDAKAFVIVADVREVLGEGFEPI